MSNSDCGRVYEKVFAEGGGDYDLFELAQCFLDGFDPAKLKDMLRSSDSGVVSDGIFVLGEIGSLARGYIDEMQLLAKSDDLDVARDAKRLLDIYGG